MDSGGTLIRIRDFQRVKNDSMWASVPSPHVRQATQADAPAVVSLIARTEPAPILQAVDCDANRLWLGDVRQHYEQLGLTRYREALVYERDGAFVGAALCEVGPVGLNFRELASTARLHFSPDLTEAESIAVSHELSASCVRFYASLGRPFTLVCDASPVDPTALWGNRFSSQSCRRAKNSCGTSSDCCASARRWWRGGEHRRRRRSRRRRAHSARQSRATCGGEDAATDVELMMRSESSEAPPQTPKTLPAHDDWECARESSDRTGRTEDAARRGPSGGAHGVGRANRNGEHDDAASDDDRTERTTTSDSWRRER